MEHAPDKIGRAVRMFMCADRLHRTAIDTQVKKLGIHRSQHILLMSLARAASPPSQADLARALEISPAAVTVSLRTLEKYGMVERTAQRGSRAKSIRLTALGEDVVRRTDILFRSADEAMFEGIPEDDLDTMIRVLTRMQQNLRDFSAGTGTYPCPPDGSPGKKG